MAAVSATIVSPSSSRQSVDGASPRAASLEPMRRFLVVAAAFALVLAACGESRTLPDGTLAVRANAELSLGTERLLVGLVGPEGERLGDPDTQLALTLAPIDRPGDRLTVRAEFLWIVPGAFGLYRADVVFDTAGTWEAVATAEDGSSSEPVLFTVLEDGFAPRVGESAPRVATATGTVGNLGLISTDPDPDPAFYRLSLDEALDNGRPTVIVFATPRFCETSACGPLLDQVKAISRSHADIDFVHVEVFLGFDSPDFDPDDPSYLVPAVLAGAYNLISEPWVFVTNADGIITARFEGVASDAEFEASLP